MITEVMEGTIKAYLHDDGHVEVLMYFNNGGELYYQLSADALAIVPSLADNVSINGEKV